MCVYINQDLKHVVKVMGIFQELIYFDTYCVCIPYGCRSNFLFDSLMIVGLNLKQIQQMLQQKTLHHLKSLCKNHFN